MNVVRLCGFGDSKGANTPYHSEGISEVHAPPETNVTFQRCLANAPEGPVYTKRQESVCVNAVMTLAAQSHWPQWSHLRMGLQPILEQLHCGQ